MKIINSKGSFLIVFLILLCSSKTNTEQKPGFALRINPLKSDFYIGEDVILNFIITNTKASSDSLLNMWDDKLLSKTKIWNDNNNDCPYEAMHLNPEPQIYTVFKSGESKSFEVVVNNKGMVGYPFFIYFPIGNFNIETKLIDLFGLPIISNISSFRVLDASREEIEAFKAANKLFEIYTKNTATCEDTKNSIDLSREFLYKYTNSIYIHRIMRMFEMIRCTAQYRYDKSFADDIKFYVKQHPDGRYNRMLIGRIFVIFSALNEKVAGIEYLKDFKSECTNNNLKSIIDEVKTEIN